MTSVGIRELRQNASAVLRKVIAGETVEVTDHGHPIARIVPYRSLGSVRIRLPAPGAPRLRDIPLPPPLPMKTDIVALLLEDREKGR